ncbi:MAG TPA: ABC transporter ATP-binding protein [Kineosporiaceae bacterium]|nr:ABC transporter ATP-binding protein [Kineosporiaceae bacterium]
MTETNGAAVQIVAPTEPTEPTDSRPGKGRRSTPKSTVGVRPTVIVDNLHITYRVFATGRPAGSKDNQNRWLKRSPSMRRAREVHAVRGISFTAYEGEAIGVVGSNGSGKSTLLKAIAGLVPSSQGAVYSDTNPTLLGVNAAIINELSGERNIMLGGLALGMSLDEVKAKYQEIVEFAGIKEEFLDLPMRTYSSGMAARLRFAIAASVSHRVLLVDEALAVGDKGFQKRSEQRIRELRSTAGTVFLVSHALPAITKTCNRVLWVEQGQLKMDGPTKEVVDAYSNSAS